MAGHTAPSPVLEPTLAARLRGGKRPVRSEDLDVYAAIVGRAPTTQERDWAINTSMTPTTALAARPAPSWIERSLGLSIHFSRPQLAAWVRKVSADARRRLRAYQTRFRA